MVPSLPLRPEPPPLTGRGGAAAGSVHGAPCGRWRRRRGPSTPRTACDPHGRRCGCARPTSQARAPAGRPGRRHTRGAARGPRERAAGTGRGGRPAEGPWARGQAPEARVSSPGAVVLGSHPAGCTHSPFFRRTLAPLFFLIKTTQKQNTKEVLKEEGRDSSCCGQTAPARLLPAARRAQTGSEVPPPPPTTPPAAPKATPLRLWRPRPLRVWRPRPLQPGAEGQGGPAPGPAASLDPPPAGAPGPAPCPALHSGGPSRVVQAASPPGPWDPSAQFQGEPGTGSTLEDTGSGPWRRDGPSHPLGAAGRGRGSRGGGWAAAPASREHLAARGPVSGAVRLQGHWPM